ncbi:MAG: A24 family peptidase [Proteobacteria bacterium]|nr:A24 family peptidase [Pseudomonadota bacterium]
MSLIGSLTHPTVFPWLCLAIGLCVGSFLNVVIYRLPKIMERDWQMQCAELRGEEPPGQETFNLAVPRSRCPACAHPISAIENIPIASYVALGGKCSACGAGISPRYPLIEAMSGLAGAYAAWHFGFGLAAVAAMLFLWSMIALSFIDFDTQLLPDSITLPLVWGGLLLNLNGTFTDLGSSVIGAAAGYLSLWCVYWGFKFATGKEGMGFGDFKLLAAVGAWLGWQMLPFVVLASSFVGAIFGIGLMLVAKRGRNVPIPFGPYLAVAGAVALFWGKPLTYAYMKLL